METLRGMASRSPAGKDGRSHAERRSAQTRVVPPMTGIGINVPNFGPQTDARALLSWTRFAESNGFAAIVMSDHVAPTREVTDLYPPPFYDPLTTIAWLAGQSENLLFATSVLVVPYRHPLLTARVSAMLHEMSGGRFALGVGVGWSATEFAALGADYAHRGPITDHYLQVITTAWQQRRIDADLASLRITDVATGPNPAARRRHDHPDHRRRPVPRRTGSRPHHPRPEPRHPAATGLRLREKRPARSPRRPDRRRVTHPGTRRSRYCLSSRLICRYRAGLALAGD
jgi:alkanesulfonate monooxygenase SsuD/methylene tetrahydromethanopterin reductase-like flavin-dependent oxidoreductase (luciferase family)